MAKPLVILDSCILIEIQRGNLKIKDRLYELEQDDLYITPVVLAEFYRGAFNKDVFNQCKKLVNKFGILSLNESVANVFTDLFEKYSLSHRPAIADMLIAATAIHYDCYLYTLNYKDFSFIKDLKLLP